MEAEALEISVKLQSLLNIPSTKVTSALTQRTDPEGGEAQPAAQPTCMPLVADQPINMRPGPREGIQTKEISPLTRVNTRSKPTQIIVPSSDNVLVQRISSQHMVLPSSVSQLKNKPVYTTKQDNETTPPPFPRSDTEKTEFVKFQNHGNVVKSTSRIVHQINEQLRNDKSPRPFVQLKSKLITEAVEEQKPGFQLKFIDPELIGLFNTQGVEVLTKKSAKFIRAKYICKLCNYHMDNIPNIISHVSSPRHKVNAKLRNLERDLDNLPIVTENHLKSLSTALHDVMEQHGIGEEEMALRSKSHKKLDEHLAPFKMCLTIFGSSYCGFGFKTSDINYNLDVFNRTKDSPFGNDPHTICGELVKILRSFSFIGDVTEGKHALHITFTDYDINRNCSLHINNTIGTNLADAFYHFDKLDPRVRPLVVGFRMWARLTGIDDQEEGYFPGHSFTVMVLKHLLDEGVLPNILTIDATGQQRILDSSVLSDVWNRRWVTFNNECLGSLWLSLLKKYTKFPYKECVISISSEVVLRSEDKAWNKRLCIEDPIMVKTNLTRSASHFRVFDYIMNRLKLAYKYFSLPLTLTGCKLFDSTISIRCISGVNKDALFYYNILNSTSSTPKFGNFPRNETLLSEQRNNETDKQSIRMVKVFDYAGSAKVHMILEDSPLLHQLSVANYGYTFDADLFQGDEKPPKICKGCYTDGHTRKNCPDEVVPQLKPVPYPDQWTIRTLDHAMQKVYLENVLTENDLQARQILLQDVYNCLNFSFPDVELTLFGSSRNGFGVRGSDADICIRFANHPIRKNEFRTDQVKGMLKGIVVRLRLSDSMEDVFAIPSAKVPIIKFKHKQTQLAGDICLSNDLALRNTKLLHAYTKIDQRVQILGCFIKQLTKICEIGDASRGSLSSYAYVLMLIHFLQQHTPPLLPVLQQIPTTNRPIEEFEDWDAYFYRDFPPFKNLKEHWNEFGRNLESVAELFLGFIRYYTESFNFEERVVTISQLEPLYKRQKCWPSLITIEDPFEKSHNLGAGLSKRMSVFIIKVFQHFREIYSTSISNYSPNIDYSQVFLLRPMVNGRMIPPVDRQCRICNKIGHFANNCTAGFRHDRYSPDDSEIGEYRISPEPTVETANPNSVQVDIHRLTEPFRNVMDGPPQARHNQIVDDRLVTSPSPLSVPNFNQRFGGEEGPQMVKPMTMLIQPLMPSSAIPQIGQPWSLNTNMIPRTVESFAIPMDARVIATSIPPPFGYPHMTTTHVSPHPPPFGYPHMTSTHVTPPPGFDMVQTVWPPPPAIHAFQYSPYVSPNGMSQHPPNLFAMSEQAVQTCGRILGLRNDIPSLIIHSNMTPTLEDSDHTSDTENQSSILQCNSCDDSPQDPESDNFSRYTE